MPAAYPQALSLLNVDQILDNHPLVVGPEMAVEAVIEQMSQSSKQICELGAMGPEVPPASQYQSGCALVIEGSQLVGILTERDVVRLVAEEINLRTVAVGEVMTQPLITLKRSDAHSVFAVLTAMRQHRIRQLPIVDGAGALLGLVTQTAIRRAMHPFNFLKLRRVGEVMTRAVVQAKATDSLLDLTRQMAHHRVSCVVITQVKQQGSLRLNGPIGIVTERDIVQFRALGLSLSQTMAQTVMSAPLFLMSPQDSLWAAQQEMQQRHIRRLVVANEAGELAGIVTQTSLLQMLDPLELLTEIEQLQQAGEAQAVEITRANQQLQQTNDALQAEISERQRLEQVLQAAHRSLEERFGLQAAQLVQTDEALRQERNFIAAVLDTVGALVVVLDRSGQIVRFNQACEHISGYRADDVCGQEIWNVLIPPAERAEVKAVFQQVKQTQSPNQHENYWLCRDDTRRLISWSNTVLKDAAGAIEYVIGTGIDVTEQRQIERTLARQYQQARLLSEITRRIRESLEIGEILRTAATEVHELLDCDRVLIIEFDSPTTGQVIQESLRQGETLPSALHQRIAGHQLRPETSASTCACGDLPRECPSPDSATFLKRWGAQACIEIVIHVGDQPWGLLTAIQCDRPRQWEAFEIELLQQLANHMGVAIAQAQLLDSLEAQVEQRSHELIQTNQQLRQEIRDRTQTEAALRESQQKLAGILDNADEAIISIDSQQRIVMYNQGAEKIFGYTLNQVHHQPLDMLLPEAFQQAHRRHVQNFAAAADTSRQMANRSRDVLGRRKTGETFPAEASISKLQTNDGRQLFTVILKDITEQRRAEAALLRREEQLRLTTNALPVLICSVDREQRYLFNNHTYADWYRIPLEDLQGRHVHEVMGEAYYGQAQPHIEAALSGQQVSFEAEVTTPDGQPRCLLTTYIPEIDGQGEVKGFFGLTNDISDRKATERMKDEFVSVVGHELRTPLTSIHGSLSLLASQKLGVMPPPAQEFLEIALKNTQRLTRLINDVLDLERIESGRVTMAMQTCPLTDLMSQAVQAMQSMADAKTILLTLEPMPATVWVDADHIIQVFTNLLSNAIKFSPADTTVWLGATRREHDILVWVKDQGRGIPPSKLDTIFESFQQVDASDSRQLGGTGLGLAICKNIVQRHGGEIWAESTPDVGSTIFFTLPDAQ
ncbi:PAS domain S-box protein [Nodosilinea sp. LEGE 07088]|uniref:PAS domain S-box protein n=1 Tax=Nodosilinea sp. LEGE 07088 TaxID=2777968 RepID=UPI001880BC1A|nr:PAS domain S-box protein [Nodosilinea sp. LEGE 07088]MBE9139037.1 PAS domain S-box protein [Nodosilinea sp. LEGE 07088]